MSFEDCLEKVTYTRKIRTRDFHADGRWPVVSQEEGLVNGYWDNASDLFRVATPLVVFGDHTRVLKYVDFDFVLGADGVKILQPRKFLVPKFFFYQLMNAPLKSLGYSRHYRLLRDLEIKYPPIPEQARIVTLLDRAFAEVRLARANTQRNRSSARELLASFMSSRFLSTGHEWVETTIDQLSTNLDSRRMPITKSDRSSGEYPYYGASGIVDFVEDYIFDGDALLISEDGANLLARATPIAFSVSGKYWVNNHAHVLKFENLVTQRYAEFYLSSVRLDSFVTGAAQPKLTQKALNSIPIWIPRNVDLQAAIVGDIERMSTHADHLYRLYQQKLLRLVALEESLLSSAFAGTT